MKKDLYAPANTLVCSFLMVVAMLVAYATKKYHFIYLPESGACVSGHCLPRESCSCGWHAVGMRLACGWHAVGMGACMTTSIISQPLFENHGYSDRMCVAGIC